MPREPVGGMGLSRGMGSGLPMSGINVGGSAPSMNLSGAMSEVEVVVTWEWVSILNNSHDKPQLLHLLLVLLHRPGLVHFLILQGCFEWNT